MVLILYHVRHATKLTMDRQGIRALAAEELGLSTSKFMFANSEEEYQKAVATCRLPLCYKACNEFIR